MTDAGGTPPLSEAYRRARKGYGLVAGLLLAWELIGIELSAEPVGTIPIALQSPDAAPLVLFALVIYFGFRLTLEWLQCEPARREQRAARIDVFLAHTIGALAVATFVAQRVTEAQLYDVLAPSWAPVLLAIFTFLSAVGFTVALCSRTTRYPPIWLWPVGVVVFFFLTREVSRASISALLLWLGFGAAVGVCSALILVWWASRPARPNEQDGTDTAQSEGGGTRNRQAAQ